MGRLSIGLVLTLAACGSITTNGKSTTTATLDIPSTTDTAPATVTAGRSGLESTYEGIDAIEGCLELATLRSQLYRDLVGWEKEGNEVSSGYFRDYLAAADARLTTLNCGDFVFESCEMVKSPLTPESPGWNPDLDRDDDGVACEG